MYRKLADILTKEVSSKAPFLPYGGVAVVLRFFYPCFSFGKREKKPGALDQTRSRQQKSEKLVAFSGEGDGGPKDQLRIFYRRNFLVG